MKHFLIFLSSLTLLSFAVAGCKKSESKVEPDYSGSYVLTVQNSFQYAGKNITETAKGTLVVAKGSDSNYTFTEQLPAFTNTYTATANGADFKLETKAERVQIDGVGYMAPHSGFGQFQANGVKINRTASFVAGSFIVNKSVELTGYK